MSGTNDLRERVARRARGVWRYFADYVDWTSNFERRRPRLAERTDIHDPTAGWTGPRRYDDEMDAERRAGDGE